MPGITFRQLTVWSHKHHRTKLFVLSTGYVVNKVKLPSLTKSVKGIDGKMRVHGAISSTLWHVRQYIN